MKELWKQSNFANGHYIFSNFGRVINTVTGGFVKPQMNNSGYYKITNSFTSKNTYIHKEVAELFLGKQPENTIVNHIDGNKFNNHITNLEYISQSENIIHANQTLRKGRIKIFNSDLSNIIKMFESGMKQTRIADCYNCDKTTIGKHIKKYYSNNLNIETISSQD